MIPEPLSFQYRGLSMRELDEMIDWYKAHRSENIVRENARLHQMLTRIATIIREAQETSLLLTVGRKPDTYWHDVTLTLGEALKKIEYLYSVEQNDVKVIHHLPELPEVQE